MRVRVVVDVRKFGDSTEVYVIQRKGWFRWKEIGMFWKRNEALEFAEKYATIHGNVVREFK